MKIRRATVSDTDTLLELYQEVQGLHAEALPELFLGPSPGPAECAVFQKWVEDPAALWLLAEQDGALGYLYAQFHDVGETFFRPALRVCNISQLSVRPESRRKGVARRLVSSLVEEADKLGFDRIELEVWSFNRGARAAFARLGFEVLNERMQLRKF